jgi:hypothetical protein
MNISIGNIIYSLEHCFMCYWTLFLIYGYSRTGAVRYKSNKKTACSAGHFTDGIVAAGKFIPEFPCKS